MQKKFRVNVYMDADLAHRLEVVSRMVGMSKSATAALALRSGMSVLELSIDPQMAAYFESVLKSKSDDEHYTE